jgi:hypothetical protein
MAGSRSRHGEVRDAHRILVGKPEGKRPFGVLRRKCEYNIKIELKEIECGKLNGFK